MKGSPFKFLDSFTKEDKDIFFGREKEAEEIYSRVFQSKLLLVYGASGTGKTSLIQCGLANKFNDSDWLPVIIRRGGNMIASVRSQLENLAITPLRESLSLKKSVQSLYLDHFKPIYLIFDQFEELFIFGSAEEIKSFVSEAASILHSDLQCKFIFVIRGEYLEHLTAFEEELPEFFNNRIRIEKMTRHNASSAITGPCRKAGIEVEEGFAPLFLDALSPDKADVELTYLQVYLDKLYKKAVEQNPDHPVFTRELLEKLGKISDVLSDFLDEQIAKIPDPETALAVLKSFVSMEGTKRQIDTTEIEAFTRTLGKNISTGAVEQYVRQFVDLRILRDKDENGKYELRHDSLAVKIYEKITLVEKELIDVRILIENAHKNFIKRKILINESDLAYISPFERNLFLNESLHRFLDDSKRHASKTKRRRRNVLIGIAVVLFSVLSGFTLWALSERSHALDQSLETEKQKQIAEKERNEALVLKDEALKANETALREKSLAERNEKSAMVAMHQADLAKQQALNAMTVAEREKSNAMTQSDIAKKEARNAEEQKEIARKEKQKAEESEQKARKGFILSLAQGIALKSPIYKNDLQLESLLAYQAYKLNRDNNGPKQDPVIFDALAAAAGASRKVNMGDDDSFFQTNEYVAVQEAGDSLLFASRLGLVFSTGKNCKGSILYSFRNYRFAIDKIFFSPVGSTIITSHVNNEICLWTQPKPKIPDNVYQKLSGHKNLVRAVAFNSAGTQFTSGGKDSLVIIWSMNAGKAKLEKSLRVSSAVKALTYSKQENSLYCLLEDGKINILDLQSFTFTVMANNGNGKPVSMALNRKKNILMLGLANGMIRSEDLEHVTHSEIRTHLSGIDFLVFNQDYSLLASAGSDRGLKIYSAENMDMNPISIKDINSKARAVTFVSGNNLFVSFANHSCYLIETSCDKLAGKVFDSLKRNMTKEEWIRFYRDLPYEKTKPGLP